MLMVAAVACMQAINEKFLRKCGVEGLLGGLDAASPPGCRCAAARPGWCLLLFPGTSACPKPGCSLEKRSYAEYKCRGQSGRSGSASKFTAADTDSFKP